MQTAVRRNRLAAMGALLLAMVLGGCATTPAYVLKMREHARETSLASLPPGSPPVYRAALEFLWELREEEKSSKAKPSKPCQSSFGRDVLGVTRDSCSFTVLGTDAKLLARWEALARDLLALPHTGRFSDDLLLERLRFLHLRAADGIEARAVVELRERAEALRIQRFLLADVGPTGPRDPSADAPAEALRRKRTITFPGECDCELVGLRSAAAGQESTADFLWLARALVDVRSLDARPRLSPLRLPANCTRINYSCSETQTLAPLVHGELNRVLRAEVASGAASPRRPASQVLKPLEATLAREEDPLLRDVYAWLVGLARDNPAFPEEQLRGGARPLFEQLGVLDQHAAWLLSALVRERAGRDWVALTRRALDRPWTGQLEQDLSLLQAMLLLEQGGPPSADLALTSQLASRLKTGAPTFAQRTSVARLVTARLTTGGARVTNLVPLASLLAGVRPSEFSMKGDVEGALNRRASDVVTQLSSSGKPETPGGAVLRWIAAVLDPVIAAEGPGAERAATCLADAGFRLVTPDDSDLLVRVVANEVNERSKEEKTTRQVTETYFLTPDEQKILERGLKNELAELERVEDYAAYARGRAARMKAADDKLRYGRETARDRNFDARAAKVNQAAADARSWVEAERARIQQELAELGAPRERTKQVTRARTRSVFEARVQLRLQRGDQVLRPNNGSARKDTSEAAVAEQSRLLCDLARGLAPSIRQHRAKALTQTSDGGSEVDRLANEFIKKRDEASLVRFLGGIAEGAP